MKDPTTEHKRPKKKAWSQSVGPYGHRIRLYEETSGIVYAEMRDLQDPTKTRCISLRHKDRALAQTWAHDQVAKWLKGEDILRTNIPTVSRVLSLYARYQTPSKVESGQDADERHTELWTRVLGAETDLSKLSLRDWQTFIERRRSGSIDSRGNSVVGDDRATVRDATVEADLVFLMTVLNWATKWKLEDHRYLMQENPARGYSIPSERNPRRPVVTEDRFQKVRAVAHQVTSRATVKKKLSIVSSYLPELLDLVNGTGRRISAVVALRYEDLRLNEGPYGSITWPAATDKGKKEWTIPMAAPVRAAVDRVIADRPGIRKAFLFPAINNPARHVPVEVASAWLVKAEALAGVTKHVGSLWHAYRRKWATERKTMPLVDVAAAGGWSDPGTLLKIYQQPDQATMFAVVSEPTPLVEIKRA